MEETRFIIKCRWVGIPVTRRCVCMHRMGHPWRISTSAKVTDQQLLLPDTGTYKLLVGDADDNDIGTYSLYLQRTNNPANPSPISFRGDRYRYDRQPGRIQDLYLQRQWGRPDIHTPERHMGLYQDYPTLCSEWYPPGNQSHTVCDLERRTDLGTTGNAPARHRQVYPACRRF